MKEHAARRRHTKPVEDLWVLERQVDELVHLVTVRVRVRVGGRVRAKGGWALAAACRGMRGARASGMQRRVGV